MMGHQDMFNTWRYIQEELTGLEITQTEASMAHAAILGEANQKGVEELKCFVLRYFKVDRLDLIDPDDLQEYLESLHEDGLYRVTPHSIETKDGYKYTILIEISEEVTRWHSHQEILPPA